MKTYNLCAAIRYLQLIQWFPSQSDKGMPQSQEAAGIQLHSQLTSLRSIIFILPRTGSWQPHESPCSTQTLLPDTTDTGGDGNSIFYEGYQTLLVTDHRMTKSKDNGRWDLGYTRKGTSKTIRKVRSIHVLLQIWGLQLHSDLFKESSIFKKNGTQTRFGAKRGL